MFQRISLFVLTIGLVFCLYSHYPEDAFSQVAKPKFVEGEVLVQYKENHDVKEKFLKEWLEYKGKKDVQGRRRVLQEQRKRIEEKGKRLVGVTIKNTFPLLALQQVEGAQEESTEELRKRLMAMEDVEHVWKNYEIQPLTHNSSPPNEKKWVEEHYWKDRPGKPIIATLWGLEKIGMKKVWNDPTLRPIGDIVVAIIDSGVDATHPDLAPNMWQNPSPGKLNPNIPTDMERDGKHGANFTYQKGYDCQKTQSGEKIFDETGHGTMMAGVIGAKGDNNQSPETGNEAADPLGVNWQGHVKLMGLKVFCKDSNGQPRGTVSGAIAAINYATEKNVHIINASWVVGGVEIEDDVSPLFEAIKKAHANDILFVTGAGNRPSKDESEKYDNDQHPKFPANFQSDNVVAVAATFINDELHWESNWGTNTVHISAPGSQIFSTFSRIVSGKPTMVQGGTSLAAPFVAGCAAYMQAIRKAQDKPILKPIRLREILMTSGDQPKDDNGNLILSKGIDGQRVNLVHGGRRLNCAGAIQRVANSPS